MRGLAEQLEGAQFALTGEGRIDAQTAAGKTIAGVAQLARAAGVPVVAFGGKVDGGAEAALARAGIVCVPISDGPRTLDEALRDAGELLARAAERVARLLRPR
jgi:glycerate kinase